MSKTRVMLVEDHTVVRAGLRMLVNNQPDMAVVAEAETAAAALQLVGTEPADVVLLDLTLPGGGSLQFIEALAARAGAPRVLVLTMHEDPAYARAALAAGATGYVVKTIREQELLAAVRAVHRGQLVVDLDNREQTAFLFGTLGQRGAHGRSGAVGKLSSRELEVLRLLGQGFTNQAVAEHLDLSPKTVATYRARIAEKLGLKTTADFVKYAADTGLLGPAEELS
jgi:DNA-binding NarL/FixJ family response regulator